MRYGVVKVKDVNLQLEFLHVELKENKCEDEFYVESFAPRATEETL